MASQLERSEILSRFITSRSHIRLNCPRVKRQAFKPEFFNGRLEISVYRTNGLSTAQVFQIGVKGVGKGRSDKIKGWGDLSVSDYEEARLLIEPNLPPDERHANVLNWPSDEADIMAITQQLAQKANFVPSPTA